ncbi:MAG: DUF11 domain-containing protein [Planctomycetaceae bacterium]|nr:DUF11 domain-containing protein [Planctomycetaceae bacterium]
MQNLLWKFVVLTGVIGASSAVVYQAHKEISQAQARGSENAPTTADPAALQDAPLANNAGSELSNQLSDWHSLLSEAPTPTGAPEVTPAVASNDAETGSLFAGGWPPTNAGGESAAPNRFPVAASPQPSPAENVEAESFAGPFGRAFATADAAPTPATGTTNAGNPFPTQQPETAGRVTLSGQEAQPAAPALTPLPEGHPGPVLMAPPQGDVLTANHESDGARPTIQPVEAQQPAEPNRLPLFLGDQPHATRTPATNAAGNEGAGNPFDNGSGTPAASPTPDPFAGGDANPEPASLIAPQRDLILTGSTPSNAATAETNRTESAAEVLPEIFPSTLQPQPADPSAATTGDESWPAIRPQGGGTASNPATEITPAADPFSGGGLSSTRDPEPSPYIVRPNPGVAEPELFPTKPNTGDAPELTTIPQRRPESAATPELDLNSGPTLNLSPRNAPEPAPLKSPDSLDVPFGGGPTMSERQPEPFTPRDVPNVVQPQQPLTGTGTVPSDAPRGPQQPELKIEKIAPTEAIVGEPLIYSIIVRNIGGSAAENVVVEDRIPRGVDAREVGTSPQAFVTGDKLFWELGTLAPGQEQKIQLRVIPIEAGEIGSVATVSFKTSVAASIRVTAPKLGIVITGPSEVAVGEQVNYKFRITNSGEGEARKVFIRTLLPPGVQHPGGNDLEYEIGNLPPGQSRDVELSMMAVSAGVIHPEALVTIDGDVKDDQQIDLNIIESRLTIARTGPNKRFIGRPAAYTNTITNASSEVLTGITVTEQIPPGVDWTPQPGTNARWDVQTRSVTWTIAQLRPGESQQLVAQMVAQNVGDHTGTVTALDSRGNRADLATSLAVKGFADLGIDVQRPGQPVLLGEQVSMRVAIRNDGTASAKNVQAAFEIPRGLNFVSAKGPVAFNPVGSMVAFSPIDELAVGEKQEFDIILTAAEINPDARVKVHLDTADLESPIQREELIRISE